MMDFVRKLFYNLAFLIIAGIILYVIFPEIMGGVFQISWGILGPLAVLMVIVYAMPRRRRQR